MPNSSSANYNLIQNWRGKGFITDPKSINPKVNLIERLEFELTYFDVAVKHVTHYSTGTSQFNQEIKISPF